MEVQSCAKKAFGYGEVVAHTATSVIDRIPSVALCCAKKELAAIPGLIPRIAFASTSEASHVCLFSNAGIESRDVRSNAYQMISRTARSVISDQNTQLTSIQSTSPGYTLGA